MLLLLVLKTDEDKFMGHFHFLYFVDHFFIKKYIFDTNVIKTIDKSLHF